MTRLLGSTVAPPVLAPRDVVAGLGAAPRDLLAACLALFDDSRLQHRLETWFQRLGSKAGNAADDPADAETVAALRSSLEGWKTSALSDDALRVVLWIYLREAFGLPAVTFASMRSAGTAADDVVARALKSLRPGALAGFMQKMGGKDAEAPAATLDALARQTMSELMSAFLEAKDVRSRKAREALFADLRGRLAGLSREDQARLMEEIGADSLNDAALRKILLTGGGLGAFGASVSMAGFSAYILAAKASAFIPLVSGPGLVSMVSVLSNPVTIVAATAGVGWWLTSSAGRQVRAAVGVRVLSLLALNGIEAGAGGLRRMLEAFAELESLSGVDKPSTRAFKDYQADWRKIAAARRKAMALDQATAALMERVAGQGGRAGRFDKLVGGRGEQHDVLALSALTLGDILYKACSIDPSVLEAADFSRVEDLSDPVSFAAFAHDIESMTPHAHLGAVGNLKGYVAERVVASQLVEQGHVVEFPEASNEPGWDIAVDGIRFQIKDLGDLSGLHRHFERFDYPVFANAEIAEILAQRSAEGLPEWADKVHFVAGYDNELVEHVTRESLAAGDGMLHPGVPVFAVILSGIRNIGRMRRDEITATQAMQEVLLDGSVRAGLAVAGNHVGVGVGLLIFGPAGALVFGAVLPILSQYQAGPTKNVLDRYLRSEIYRTWSEEARTALRALTDRLAEALQEKAALLRSRQPGTSADGQPASSTMVVTAYLAWRADDELIFLREAWCRLRKIREEVGSGTSVEILATRVMTWLSTSTLHPAAYQDKLRDFSAVFGQRPSVADQVAATTEHAVRWTKSALSAVTSELKKHKAAWSEKDRG